MLSCREIHGGQGGQDELNGELKVSVKEKDVWE
jgi:hypothetical protein